MSHVETTQEIGATVRIVVVGGNGHIGTFLVPRLVRAGHEVINLSRTGTPRYARGPEWEQVTKTIVDRKVEDRDGTFAATVLAQRPDVVVDLICFTPSSATALVEGLRGHTGHLLHCGSIWRHGPSRKLPISEDSDAAAAPIGEYGISKAAIVDLLKQETASGGLATTSLHPGHIVGPGWWPIGPLGSGDPDVWRTIAANTPLPVPGDGTQMMHHVHADDVAQAFELAITHRDAAAGEDFNIVAPTALSVRGLVEIAAGWFGTDGVMEQVTWEEFRTLTIAQHYAASWDHLSRSQCFSIDKARRLLDYQPAYEPEAAIAEALRWLVDHGELDVSFTD